MTSAQNEASNVTPYFASTYLGDGGEVNFVACRQDDERFVATHADRAHLRLGEARLGISLTVVVRDAYAPLARCIAHIVGLGAIENVARTNASTIVAMMTSKSLRPAAMLDEEGDAIDTAAPLVAIFTNRQVWSAGVFEVSAGPQPTSTEPSAKKRPTRVDSRPKALGQRQSRVNTGHELEL